MSVVALAHAVSADAYDTCVGDKPLSCYKRGMMASRKLSILIER